MSQKSGNDDNDTANSRKIPLRSALPPFGKGGNKGGFLYVAHEGENYGAHSS
jgi:hypothetical protein